LGSQLLDLTLSRAHELGSKKIIIYANERNSASNSFLKHYGFAAVGSSGSMNVNEKIPFRLAEFPAGYMLKRYSDINEPVVLLNALNDCYLDMWGHQHSEHHTEEELRSPRFLNYYQAEDILLLSDPQGVVCGICSVKSEGKRDAGGNLVDLLDAPGVIKKYRQDGYQLQLVLAGIDHLRKKATRPIVLEFWGESEQALAQYRTIGFEMLNHYVTYHKELE
jgi:ribosomal protein S18 acetylase RimI-like enzyme